MDLKISQLIGAASAQGGDEIAMARAGGSYKLTLTQVQTFVLGTLATDVATNQTNITALQNDRLKIDGSNGPMTGSLTMGAGFWFIQSEAPTSGTHVVNKTYVDTNFLNLGGGTMTGPIILHSTGTPSNGAEPISYTFAENTYAKASGTPDYVARFTPTGTVLDDSILRDNGSVASANGVVNASYQFTVYSTLEAALRIEQTGTGALKNGLSVETNGANSSTNVGIRAIASSTGGGLVDGIFVNASASAGAGNIRGVEITAANSGTAANPNVIGLQINNLNIVGTSAGDVYGINVNGVIGTGAVTNAYGVYVGQHSTGTNKYGIYQVGANDVNYFAGDVYIGATTGTTKFRLVDGTEAADYYLQTDSNGNASWALLNSATLDGITGTTNQVAYFSGTDIISGDADWLFDGTTMSIGESLDATVLSNAYTSSLATTMKVENANTSGITYAISAVNNAASASANYAIYADVTNGGAGAAWGIYQVGTGSTNYMEGNTAIGLSNSLNRLGSHTGMQINGDDDNKAVIAIDSNSTQNSYIAINHNSVDSDAGVTGDLNSLVVFQEDYTTKWALGLNGTASSAGNCRSIAQEFVLSNGDTFDDRSDRQLVIFPTGEFGIGTDAVEGSPLTIGTATKLLEINDAATGGVEGTNTMNGYIKVYLSSDDDGGTGEVPGTQTVAYIRTYDGIA
jgi:hypothetical protein